MSFYEVEVLVCGALLGLLPGAGSALVGGALEVVLLVVLDVRRKKVVHHYDTNVDSTTLRGRERGEGREGGGREGGISETQVDNSHLGAGLLCNDTDQRTWVAVSSYSGLDSEKRNGTETHLEWNRDRTGME